MLDVRRIREEPDAVRSRLAVRGNPGLDAAIDRVLELDASRRELVAAVDEKRARRNEVSPRVAALKKAGQAEEADAVIREMRELGEGLSALEARLAEVEAGLERALLEIPNTPAEDVPPGREGEGPVLREWGEEPEPFERRPHWEVGESLGILDLPRGARVTGSGFPVYMGQGARLERALINFMVDLHAREHGYTEIASDTELENDASLAAHLALGFEEVERQICFRKRLGEP